MPYYNHALFNTVTHLNKLGIHLPARTIDTSILSLFHLKQYHSVYTTLSRTCPTATRAPAAQSSAHADTFFFCTCHDTRDNFLRNYALYIHKRITNTPITSTLVPFTDSPFILYVCALLEKDASRKEDMLLRAIEQDGLFVDAYGELMGVLRDVQRMRRIGSGKRGNERYVYEVFRVEYFCYRFVDLGIDENEVFVIDHTRMDHSCTDNNNGDSIDNHNGCGDNNNDNDTNNDNNNNYSCIGSVNDNDSNMVSNTNTPITNSNANNDITNNNNNNNNNNINTNTAITNTSITSTSTNSKNVPYLMNLMAAYHYHMKKYALSLHMFRQCTLADYFDLYSNILYIHADVRALSVLCYNMHMHHPFRAETYACTGNLHSLEGRHATAIRYFKKAIAMNGRYVFLNTLIAHEYVELREYNTAIRYYARTCGDYRSFFGMGQAYAWYSGRLAICFYNKALAMHRKDPFIWQCLANEYRKTGDTARAQQAYEQMVVCGDITGYLLIGDMYKNAKEYASAVVYYEKYVRVVKDESISCFLREYYNHAKMV